MDKRSAAAGRGAGVFVLALACLTLVACKGGDTGKDSAAKADNAVPVEAVAPARRTIDASYTGVATLEADSEAEVAAKIPGVLVKLLVEEGDSVVAGQALAQLDDEGPRLNLARAEAVLRKLENDYRRSSEMFARKLLSVEQNDKIRFDLETQRATYELARLELSHTTIRAPIGGVVARRMAKVGNYIQLNQALFRIDNFDPLLAVLNVPERELHKLQVGQVVGMRVDSIADARFEGRIQRISPVIDASNGTFRVTCEFRDAGGRLKSGMFGRLDIAWGRRQDVLTIPHAALIEEDGETAVFAVVHEEVPAADAANKGKAEADSAPPKPSEPAWVARRRPVRVGYADAAHVEILEGLDEGDRVITIGRAAVRDGTHVQVLEGVQ
ncbi:efflux RND transporter periplasmic adaptor subunit [Dokdonella sp.]|uniref:efflux RND transporter periplasmic adaptor subunit n=1 Tax=Dokdonella sp. TaxID=2291710 RepID=UPI0025BA7A6D|nr:efflux RND transporter periplasmic adaptor subunit [Dokdonella sp.]MBX3692831.1 efflux RND transporter periplasmic adaptor subunit [Dokdonella sp.]MCW5567774.1 efflux RND transporter periplasmic adaptor subunit [Dokdonella sp.]